MVNIKAGMTGEITFEDPAAKDRMAALPVQIHSVQERRITLSQTTPPLTDAHRGRRLLLSFLADNGGESTRYGCWAKLTGLTDYEVAPSQRVPALIIERETNPEIHNLRMSHRVKPMPNRGLAVFLKGAPLSIIDISTGGVRISSKKDLSLRALDIITLTIVVDERRFEVESRVINAWSPEGDTGPGAHKHHVSIQFLGNPTARESLLARKIILLEREQISHRVR